MSPLSTRVLHAIGDEAAAGWDALQAGGNPFVSRAFIGGLESCGCLRPDLGWLAHHVTLWRDGRLVAAAPAYRKLNSHGEFVFDHAWADAHERCGLRYYPKLLCAVPYSPVVGPRLLLAADEPAQTRLALARALREEAEARAWSGAHVNFATPEDDQALADDGWLRREDVQFHWTNAPYASFDEFLGALNAKRRKEIRRERSRVAADGWQFEARRGSELDDAQIARLHALYLGTFLDKGNYPALTAAFFARLARDPADPMLALLGMRGGRIGAMALCLRSGDTLYGRYWGADDATPGLHFEACYYRGIEWCIEQGIARFEPGAQGEHKIARGFLPVTTTSWHWIVDPRLRDAIARSLVRERAAVAGYARAAAAHSPFAEREG
jgi:hypothetical protein